MPIRRKSLAITAALIAVLAPAGAAPGGLASPPVVRFAFTGDIAMVAGPAESYFRAVSLDLTGDVVLGNLEGTLTTRSGSKCAANSPSCFAFQAPDSYARMV